MSVTFLFEPNKDSVIKSFFAPKHYRVSTCAYEHHRVWQEHSDRRCYMCEYPDEAIVLALDGVPIRAGLDPLCNALAEREGSVPGLSSMWRRSWRGFWELHGQVEFTPGRVIVREMHYRSDFDERAWRPTDNGTAPVPRLVECEDKFKAPATIDYPYALLDAWALGQTSAARGLGTFHTVKTSETP